MYSILHLLLLISALSYFMWRATKSTAQAQVVVMFLDLSLTANLCPSRNAFWLEHENLKQVQVMNDCLPTLHCLPYRQDHQP